LLAEAKRRRAETLGGSISKILWILLEKGSDIVQQTPFFKLKIFFHSGDRHQKEGHQKEMVLNPDKFCSIRRKFKNGKNLLKI